MLVAIKFTLAFILSISHLAIASPLTNAGPPTNYVKGHKFTDGEILNYALTLEHLEDKFYREGLANFTRKQFREAGFKDSFYDNLKTISAHESKHVAFLTNALHAAGVKPVPECTYVFPVKDAKSFATLASLLEGVGVSAYLGAAASITNSDYLTAAGSILTVESRHSAYIRTYLGAKPFPAPFDNPLTPNEVHSIAHGLIQSCPADTPPLPVKAFPALALDAPSAKVFVGSRIVVLTPGYVLAPKNGRAVLNGAFITSTGPVFVTVRAVKGGFQIQIPEMVTGQSYFVLVDCDTRVSDDTIVAGPVVVEVSG